MGSSISADECSESHSFDDSCDSSDIYQYEGMKVLTAFIHLYEEKMKKMERKERDEGTMKKLRQLTTKQQENKKEGEEVQRLTCLLKSNLEQSKRQ